MVTVLKILIWNLKLIFKKHAQEMKDWEGKNDRAKAEQLLDWLSLVPRISIKFGIEVNYEKIKVTAESICTSFIIIYCQIFFKVKSFCHHAEVLLPGESVRSGLVLLRGSRTKQG